MLEKESEKWAKKSTLCNVLDRNVLVVILAVGALGKVELVERTRGEFVHGGAVGRPSGGRRGRRGELGGAELVAVAAEHDDLDGLVTGAGVPHGFEHGLPLGEVAAPRVLGVPVPVLGEGHGRDDNLPPHPARRRLPEPGQEIGELILAQHRLLGRVGRTDLLRGPVSACVHHEEGRGSLGEAVVRGTGTDRRGVDRGVIAVPGVDGVGVQPRRVAIPVVRDVVVVDDMDPRKRSGHGPPVRGGVRHAVLTPVALDVGAEALGHVDVDEVAEEEHEAWLQRRQPPGHVTEPRHGQRMGQRIVRKAWLEAAGGQEAVDGPAASASGSQLRRRHERPGMVRRRSELVPRVRFQLIDGQGLGEVRVVGEAVHRSGGLPSVVPRAVNDTVGKKDGQGGAVRFSDQNLCRAIGYEASPRKGQIMASM